MPTPTTCVNCQEPVAPDSPDYQTCAGCREPMCRNCFTTLRGCRDCVRAGVFDQKETN